MSLERGVVRFMTQVLFRIGTVLFTFDQLYSGTSEPESKDLAPLNAELAAYNANVTFVIHRHNGLMPLLPQLVLNLCGGQVREKNLFNFFSID